MLPWQTSAIDASAAMTVSGGGALTSPLIYNTPGDGTPITAQATAMTFEAWGAGCGGNGASSTNARAGGGGGYASITLTGLTVGVTTINFHVGAGGPGGSNLGTGGEDSWVNTAANSPPVAATGCIGGGGTAGDVDNTGAGTGNNFGGTGATHSGGNGRAGNGIPDGGCGGGGGAGSGGDGGSTVTSTAGVGGIDDGGGGGTGGDGGHGGSAGAATAGVQPGGGGGAAFNSGSGAAGADGRVRISW